VLGPLCGAFITDHLGWRWNFWIMSMAAGVSTIGGFILIRETYPVVLLERKAERLRKETGNMKLKSKLDTGLGAKDLFWFSIVRPSKMLIFSPVVLFLSLFTAITYAYLYLFFTTISHVFYTQYHFRKDLVGLAFLGIGVGQFIGQFFYSWMSTRSYKKHEANGGFKPEYRLKGMMFGAIIIPISLFWYGWAVETKVHWMCPMVAMTTFSLGILYIW
jgi:MFS family permease